MACLWSYPSQEKIHSMYGSTTISLTKLHIMFRICQKYFIATVGQDWVMLWYSIIANKGRNGSITTIATKHLTEHHQNTHGSLCSIKFTWQQNNSRQGLREITKSLKIELASAPLCKFAQVTTHILKIHGLHLWKDGKTDKSAKRSNRSDN